MSCGCFGCSLMRGDCLRNVGILPTGIFRHSACGNCRSTFAKGEHMRVKHFAVSITAAAVMGAFGTAFAQSSTDQSAQTGQSSGSGSTSQPSTSSSSSTTAPSGGVNVNPNVGVDANVGISNTDVNAGANVGAGVN